MTGNSARSLNGSRKNGVSELRPRRKGGTRPQVNRLKGNAESLCHPSKGRGRVTFLSFTDEGRRFYRPSFLLPNPYRNPYRWVVSNKSTHTTSLVDLTYHTHRPPSSVLSVKSTKSFRTHSRSLEVLRRPHFVLVPSCLSTLNSHTHPTKGSRHSGRRDF